MWGRELNLPPVTSAGHNPGIGLAPARHPSDGLVIRPRCLRKRVPVGSPAVPPGGIRSPVVPDEVHSQSTASPSGPASGRPHSEPSEMVPGVGRIEWIDGQSRQRKGHAGLRATAAHGQREERHHRRRAVVDAAGRARSNDRCSGHADHWQGARPCRLSAVDRHRLSPDGDRDGAALWKDFRHLRAAADHFCCRSHLPRGVVGERHRTEHAGAGRRPGHTRPRRRRPVHNGPDRHRRSGPAIRTGALCRVDFWHMGRGRNRRAAGRRHVSPAAGQGAGGVVRKTPRAALSPSICTGR